MSKSKTPADAYDVVVIGCGFSGMAAALRLSIAGKKVCLLERHSVPGGLNSYYSVGGRKFDVGLHAMTNCGELKDKSSPLNRIYRQLRIPREQIPIYQQVRSAVVFRDCRLDFDNDIELFRSEIAANFPAELDAFNRLVQDIPSFDDLVLSDTFRSAREYLKSYFNDPLLIEMILCPVMFYGNARENDMDVIHFGIIFRSIFLEGMARPFEGIRPLIRFVNQKIEENGGERFMRCGVKNIIARHGHVCEVILDNGQSVKCDAVISSMGKDETLGVCVPEIEKPEVIRKESEGRLSYAETFHVLDLQPCDMGLRHTTLFYNFADKFSYENPTNAVDPRSGVVCIPNNFHFEDKLMPEGQLRVTCLANFDHWTSLEESEYLNQKEYWRDQMLDEAMRCFPESDKAQVLEHTVATDMFTPRTIKKYTGKFGGAIYGTPSKSASGETHIKNLLLCGTDHGYLGIVGSMLSGITIANKVIHSK